MSLLATLDQCTHLVSSGSVVMTNLFLLEVYQKDFTCVCVCMHAGVFN